MAEASKTHNPAFTQVSLKIDAGVLAFGEYCEISSKIPEKGGTQNFKGIKHWRHSVITDLLPLELASKVEWSVREAVESVKQSLGVELAFDIFSCWRVARFVF